MKYILLLLIVVSCASQNEGKYKREFHVEDFATSMTPEAAHALLAQKMKKCYKQSEYPTYQKTVSEWDQDTQSGIIVYETDTQGVGIKRLVMVEVVKDPAGSIAKVYSKGDLFKPATVYSHQVHKWLDGKKVDCDSHGEI